MNKKSIKVLIDNHYFKLNSSSKVLDITYNKLDQTFTIEYYDSGFDDEFDLYLLVSADIEDTDLDPYRGYTFYGEYYNREDYRYYLTFIKQVDRIKNDYKE